MKKTKTRTVKHKQISSASTPKKTVKKSTNPVKKATGRKGGAAMIGGAAGAVVGAAIGGAAGAALADEKTRKKMGKTVNDFTQAAAKAADQAEQLSSKAGDASRTARDTITDTGMLDKRTKS